MEGGKWEWGMRPPARRDLRPGGKGEEEKMGSYDAGKVGDWKWEVGIRKRGCGLRVAGKKVKVHRV